MKTLKGLLGLWTASTILLLGGASAEEPQAAGAPPTFAYPAGLLELHSALLQQNQQQIATSLEEAKQIIQEQNEALEKRQKAIEAHDRAQAEVERAEARNAADGVITIQELLDRIGVSKAETEAGEAWDLTGLSPTATKALGLFAQGLNRTSAQLGQLPEAWRGSILQQMSGALQGSLESYRGMMSAEDFAAFRPMAERLLKETLGSGK